MNVFLATSRRGIAQYLTVKSQIQDAKLWINGGIDLSGFDVDIEGVSTFNRAFDLKNEAHFAAAVGTIEDLMTDVSFGSKRDAITVNSREIIARNPPWTPNLSEGSFTGVLHDSIVQELTGYVPGNAIYNSESGGADSSSAADSTASAGRSNPESSKVPASILDGDGNLPAGIGGKGTPIPMEPTSNSSVTAEEFAKAAFNGQTPVKLVSNITGEGSWVAIMPDGTAIPYRPAGQASAATATTTATVEINSAAVRNINNGNVAKFKFPSK